MEAVDDKMIILVKKYLPRLNDTQHTLQGIYTCQLMVCRCRTPERGKAKKSGVQFKDSWDHGESYV